MTTSFLDIRNEVCDLAGISSVDNGDRVKKWINEEYISLVQKTGTPIKSTPAVALVNGQGDYDLTAAPWSLTDFLRIQSLIYAWGGNTANQTATLEETQPQQIYALRQSTVSGLVRQYALNGLSTLMLYPSPLTGDTLTMSYEYRPAPMATDSDVPLLLRPEDQPALVYAAAYRGALWANPAKAPALATEMARRAEMAMARQNRAGGAAKHFRRGWRRYAPHDPSTDYRGWNGY